MNLSGLLTILDSSPEFAKLLDRLDARGRKPRLAILDAAKPFIAAALHRKLGVPVLMVTARAERAKGLVAQIQAWVEDPSDVKFFPEPDALPYERVAWDVTTIRERLGVLAELWEYGRTGRGEAIRAPVVVASAQAVMQKTISPTDFGALTHTIRRGQSVDLDQLLSTWVRMGFEAATAVEVPGTFSRRGGIVDVFSPAAELPVRLDLFGAEVESLRLFDPVTQRSVRLVDSVTVTPPREVLGSLLSDSADAPSSLVDLSGLRPEARDLFEQELARLANGEVLEDAEFYAGLTNPSGGRTTVFDFLPDGALLIVDELEEIQQMVEDLSEQGARLREGHVERGDLPADFPATYHDWAGIRPAMEAVSRSLDLTLYDDGRREAEAEELSLPFSPASPYAGRLRTVVEDVGRLLSERRRVIITSQQSRRLAEILTERDLPVQPVERIDRLPPAGSLTLVHGTLAEGWHLDIGSDLSLALLTDGEVFGVSKPRRAMRRRHAQGAVVGRMARQAFLSDLSVGDYVVHIEHGIGRFSGMTKMALDGIDKEYLVLDYAESDRLYVPVDQIDRVNRYIGVSEHVPALTRLGTQEWARAKERVKKSVQNIAEDLLKIYSAREVVQGFAFSADSVWQQELEASFPYIETPDQLEAIYRVKGDMEKTKPMDRLICGDVGYGKTEVALRAAFKAVMDGKQVAVLVPTTVLAQQHYETFRERLRAFPVNVEVLSRFRSDKDQRAVAKALKEGKVDICIGTHRLLQKDISFKDLGLLIVDEEQRFGVAHKELLKRMRTEVDVLTLTATPIPRTLHMALAGVRDMSTIETPPEERLPIKTYVTGFEDGIVRQAIIKELDRDGQVFFVHNRVENIAHIANHLMNLIPEATFAVGHGQMPEGQLEKVMLDFAAGKVDVLICTTIIESGLDMPNVNTLIVNEADHFGLAQLYQLRGRVGRGANRAYAYFLYRKNKRLTEVAQKRLKTIFQATELGAGFRIAMKDLEIRGAGNLLGVEQSGHMSAVGFDLYTRLLAQAVDELKAKRSTETGQEIKVELAEAQSLPSVDLPLVAYITEEYVSDYATRLSLYQRLAHITEIENVEEMAQELWDRFGEYPEPVKNLLYLLNLKLLAAKAGARSVVEEEGQIVVKFGSTILPKEHMVLGKDRAGLQKVGGSALKIGNMQLRLDWQRLGHRWKSVLQSILEYMAKDRDTVQIGEQIAKAG